MDGHTDIASGGLPTHRIEALTDGIYAVAMTLLVIDIKIPDDSTIKVTSSGILGGNYVAISPGGSDKMLASGGEIPNTQGSVDLFGLISKAVGGGGGASK